jgi:hypothetical protein
LDRLYAVKSILREKQNRYVVRLDVFPDDVWEFKGPFFGISNVELYDGRSKILVFASQFDETDVKTDYPRQWMSLERILYLLETKWDKPELIRVRRIQEDKVSMDVIEALVGTIRIDFHFEPEEMLVRRVDRYDKEGIVRQSYSFSDYRDVNGIKMPMKVGQKSCYCDLSKEKYSFESISYSFNVDYDPNIFTRPIKATSADAWKPKRKQ